MMIPRTTSLRCTNGPVGAEGEEDASSKHGDSWEGVALLFLPLKTGRSRALSTNLDGFGTRFMFSNADHMVASQTTEPRDMTVDGTRKQRLQHQKTKKQKNKTFGTGRWTGLDSFRTGWALAADRSMGRLSHACRAGGLEPVR